MRPLKSPVYSGVLQGSMTIWNGSFGSMQDYLMHADVHKFILNRMKQVSVLHENPEAVHEDEVPMSLLIRYKYSKPRHVKKNW